MDLQSIFYVVGTIAMAMVIILMAVIIYLAFMIKRVIINTERKFVNRIIEYTRPIDVAKEMFSNILANFFFRSRAPQN